MTKYSWDIPESLHSEKDRFQIGTGTGWNTLHIDWGKEWPADWSKRYEMFTSEGLDKSGVRDPGDHHMRLNGHSVPLYCRSYLFFEAFADICYHLYLDSKDPQAKRRLLIEAKMAREESIQRVSYEGDFKSSKEINALIEKDSSVAAEVQAKLQQIKLDKEAFVKQLKYVWRCGNLVGQIGYPMIVRYDESILGDSVGWGDKWSALNWRLRYDVFTDGLKAIQIWYKTSLMVLINSGLYGISDRSTFFAAFADICYQLYKESTDADDKRNYITQAKQHVVQAAELSSQWKGIRLTKKIDEALQKTPGAISEYESKQKQKALEKAQRAAGMLSATQSASVVPSERALPPSTQGDPVQTYPTPATAATSLTTVGGVPINFGRMLGEGASGTVYQGQWGGKEVAIKRFHVNQLRGDEAREFLQEATFMMNLQSDYLIKMHDFVAQSPNFCMIMEYMPYGSLYHVLGSDVELPWEKRWVIAMDIAYGVAALHSKDIVHRDIKSLNILIGHGFRAKLSDFGQAKLKTTSQSAKTRRSETGAVGTVAWLPPEILRDGAECSKETDMYSFGMTLWELGTRNTPFATAPNASVMARWVEQGKQEDLTKIPEPKLAGLVRWCWEFNPALRPTAEQAIGELNNATPKYATQGVVRSPFFSQ